MAEIIVGAGRQKTLRQVLHLCEAELHRTKGAARRVVMRGPGIEAIAGRHRFEGEFESFAIRLHGSGRLHETLNQLIASAGIPCSLAEIEGGYEFRCQPAHGDTEQTMRVLDELSPQLHLPEIWRVHGEEFRHEQVSLEGMFRLLVDHHASDVHLFPGSPPVIRVDNELQSSKSGDPLSAEQVLALIRDAAHERDWKDFQSEQQCSFNFHQVGLGYSRISAFMKSGVPHCTIRFLPEKIPSFEDLHIPHDAMEALAKLDYGLILVTGMTGSGKSTTVAALIDWINAHDRLHIITIEEPIEYVHANRCSIVSQRGVGVDVPTFADAVRGSLRHDPDVIFIGEMRDQATIHAAISAAATGHLVISTLHSNTSSEVINRIVSFFEPVERDLVRLQLRDAIKCVMCQRLLPKVGGGRVPAIEFLFNDTKHLNESILAGDTLGIRVGMQQDLSQSCIFEESLNSLCKADLVSLEEARLHASSPEIFEQMRLGTYHPPTLEHRIGG